MQSLVTTVATDDGDFNGWSKQQQKYQILPQ